MPMPSRIPARFLALSLVVSLAAALAGCGGGGADGSSATAGAQQQDDSGAPATERISATRAESPDAAAPAADTGDCPLWSGQGRYRAGDVVRWQGSLYTARVPHVLAAGLDAAPPSAPELWQATAHCSPPVAQAAAAALPAPPATWKENWLEHRDSLKLVAHNDSVALYFDPAVPADSAKWLLPYLTRLWQYQQKTYGGSGTRLAGGRLYVVLHQGKHFGGHHATVHDRSHGGRNVIDLGAHDWSAAQYDVATRTAARLVEALAGGHRGQPAARVLARNRALPFYVYDSYVALGMADEAARYQKAAAAVADENGYPRAGAHWFRDWLHPLWRDHGGARVMARFHALLKQHFPHEGDSYSREMNWGEYILFMSAAAGQDLKPLATTAFGWPAEREAQYQQARTDFPALAGSQPPEPPNPPGCKLASLQADALRLINQRRAAGASCGSAGRFGPAQPLRWNTRLAAAADGHSRDMATHNYFSHTSRDGRSFTQRIEAAGYRWSGAAENIAAGQDSVAAVVEAWMKSDGHCANLMGNYQEVALACAESSSSDYGRYWTMDVASPR